MNQLLSPDHKIIQMGRDVGRCLAQHLTQSRASLGSDWAAQGLVHSGLLTSRGRDCTEVFLQENSVFLMLNVPITPYKNLIFK